MLEKLRTTLLRYRAARALERSSRVARRAWSLWARYEKAAEALKASQYARERSRNAECGKQPAR